MTSIFQGKFVRLRAGEPAEQEIFWRWSQEDTEGGRHLYEIPFPTPRPSPTNESKQADDDNFPFTIETLDGTVVGAIHVHDCNLRFGTFKYGIGILTGNRRKGYAAEAIWLVLRYYFRERRYQKCTVEVYSFNDASIRLHERLGFTLEGRLRQMVYTNGAYCDLLCYGMTGDEFEEKI